MTQLPQVDKSAGITSGERSEDNCNESMMASNVMSIVLVALLALLLLPKLKGNAACHNTKPNLTIVSSGIHYAVDFDGKDAPEGIFSSLNGKEVDRRGQSLSNH
ncbi:short-chain dehydrogenase [Fusarium tjaetaba]|uniref:Short-chain dehydrogenase n=1 Tax=Fusarium tjaetaba TaxID=1567544 RepID=A0A8H5W932_9HYPO|nr:short-chain dehydrogenase [Fusarium tjaetaba]KAF5651376.1 short-chain dehydrogenase [Fusarium tjaetaba]